MSEIAEMNLADALAFVAVDAQRATAAAVVAQFITTLQNRLGALQEVEARIAARQADGQAVDDRVRAVEAEAEARIAKAIAARDAKLAALGAEQLTQEAISRELTAQNDALRAENAELESKKQAVRETLAAVRI